MLPSSEKPPPAALGPRFPTIRSLTLLRRGFVAKLESSAILTPPIGNVNGGEVSHGVRALRDALDRRPGPGGGARFVRGGLHGHRRADACFRTARSATRRRSG